MIVESGLVLAHRPLRTRVVAAIRLLLLTIDAGVAVGALASVALRQIYARGAVVTRLGRALVDVDLAASAGESGRAVAVNTVSHRMAEAAVLAHAVGALDRFALLAAHRAGAVRIHVGGTLDARGRPVLRLEEVLGALRARREPRVGIHARGALGAATIATGRRRLVRERTGRAGLAVLVAAYRRLARVAVSRTLQTGDETGGRVRAVTADRYAVVYALRAFLLGVSAERTAQADTLAIAVLIEALLTGRALLLLLSGERPGRAVY